MKIFFIQLWSINIGCAALEFSPNSSSSSYKDIKDSLFLFSLMWVFIYLPVTWFVQHVHIRSSEISSFFICLWKLVGSYSHTVRCESAPGGSEVIFQVNLLMHLASLMVWCDTDYKIYWYILLCYYDWKIQAKYLHQILCVTQQNPWNTSNFCWAFFKCRWVTGTSFSRLVEG